MKKRKKFKFWGILGLLVLATVLAFVLATTKPEVKIKPLTWRAPVQWAPPTIAPEMEPPPPVEIIPPWQGQEPAITPHEPLILPPLVRGEGVRIAIIVDDMGLGKSTEAIADLPPEVTLSFLPYAQNLREQVRDVLARGHEVMLHLPMEPLGGENPGRDALLTTLSLEEISMRLKKNLDSFEGYVGVNNHMGSKFTQYNEGMRLVIQALRERGLYFVDSRTGAKTLAAAMAHQAGLKVAVRDVFLDDAQDAASIKTQLDQLEKTAREKGAALAICHPHKLTLSLLADWLRAATARGLRIVPASEIVR